ncbi:MAG TPA: carboxypeptidase regulatory-like domain-containing protein [Gemmatimonadaceae bacterium]|nr:carboxypeptidase regulatory-like domain-containing protein [Gemmatimonadaceae bacterium]
MKARLFRDSGVISRAAWVVALTTIATVAAGAQAGTAGADTSTSVGGTISGTVGVQDANIPLPYASVGIPARSLEQFADARGHFAFEGVQPGRVTLRIRRIGFTPVDTIIDVVAGVAATVHVALVRVSVRLDTVRVASHPPCTQPGGPRPGSDAAFVSVFEQLLQNGEQALLLVREYPFRTVFARHTTVEKRDGSVQDLTTDTVAHLTTGKPWEYSPGKIVVATAVAVPGLTDFVNPTFINEHCFWYGGQEAIDGHAMLRIDFGASTAIRDPDIEGAMFLDPQTLVIRRTVVRLTKTPRSLPMIGDYTVTSVFGEVLPGVPIASQVLGVTRFVSGTNPLAAISETEFQTLLSVSFLKGKP